MKYTEWFAKNGKFQAHELWLADNLLYETILGSHAYGCEGPQSDLDILGLVMPPREVIYPSEYGYIIGFDQLPNFQRKEVKGEGKRVLIGEREVEAEWVSLIEFFYQSGLKGSPNMIEALFTRQNLVTVSGPYADILRANRKLFLSMRTFHAFKGYAHGQMHRIKTRDPQSAERRVIIEKHGYDIKMAYHVLRLLDQLDQILTVGDLDLMRNKEECKAMKRGEWGDFDRLEVEFHKRLSAIEEMALSSKMAAQPRKDELRRVLIKCIETFYSVKTTKKEYITTEDVYKLFQEINTKTEEVLSAVTRPRLIIEPGKET